MQTILAKSIFSRAEQVQVTHRRIRLATSGLFYEWRSLTLLKMYYTIWDGVDIRGNIEFFFTPQGAFRMSEFRTGGDTYYLLYHALAKYVAPFSESQVEALAVADYRKKSRILRWLGFFTNLYWGRKPVVFKAG